MTTLEEKLKLRLQEEIIENRERYGRLFNESIFADGFYAAVKQIKKIVWHTKEEKPAPNQYILITDGNGFMCDNRVDRMSPTNMWAYLSDLLPEIKHPEIPDCHASSSVKELLEDMED
jgi:hypothetical protein